MRNLLRFFIQRSFLVNLISAFIVLVGAISFLNMRRDLIPQMKFKTVTINAQLKGASAIEMEKFVTFPIEENLDGLAGIEKVTSTTRNGSSMVAIEFEAGHQNMQESLERIRARVGQIRGDLPNGMEPIQIEQVNVDSFEFLDVNINGVEPEKDHDREWVHATEEAFRKIKGIVKVESSMPDRKIFVDFDLKKLADYGISVDSARQKIANYFSYIPVGSISKNEKWISIELRYGLNSLESIKRLPLQGNESGKQIKLSDVAQVSFRFPERTKVKLYDGHPTVELKVFKDVSSDAIVLRDKIVLAIERLKKKLPSHIEVKITGDGAHFIEKQLDVLKVNGLGGLGLVAIFLFILLGFRVAFMTAGGVPLAYFGTFIVLNLLGISIDLISVVGMILVIGILVDDAIIVTENYVLNLDKGMSPQDSALEAAYSTIKPVTGTVITTAVAFAPILLIESTVSQVLYSIPVVIISALALSWFESFFILPNHLAHFVKTPSKRSENRFFKKLKHYYEKLLKRTLKWRYLLLLGLAITLVASFVLTGKMKKSFSISVGSQFLQVTAELTESQSLEESVKKLKPLHDYLNGLRDENITFISTEIGDVYIDNERRTAYRFAAARLMIDEDHPAPEQFRQQLKERIRADLEKLKGESFKRLSIDTKTKGQDDQDIITIFVSGGDKLSFEELQNKLREQIKDIPNVISLGDDSLQFQESWQFEVNKKELLRYKFSSMSLAQQLSEFFHPQELANFRLKGENLEIFTQYKKREDVTYNDLKNVRVITPKGLSIPVTKLGKWKRMKILKTIQHKDLLRKFEIKIRYDKEKTTKMEVAKKVRDELRPLVKEFPAYNFSVLEASEQEEKSKAWLISVGLICGLLILLVLAICLHSIVLPMIVMIPIPFGVIGIIFAIFAHGQELELMSIIGLVGMAGVVVNDSLIMVDSVNKLIQDDNGIGPREAILEGSLLRFRAILLTTITTIGGVVPMAYGIGGESGFTQPLAFAMGWGLLFATCLTLFVLPSLLAVWADVNNLFSKLLHKVKATKA